MSWYLKQVMSSLLFLALLQARLTCSIVCRIDSCSCIGTVTCSVLIKKSKMGIKEETVSNDFLM